MSPDIQFASQVDDRSALTRRAMAIHAAAPASLVNRTHRVVRHRASAMKARRSYVRSLLVPLALSSVLLALAGAALWTGLYQYQAAEAMQDVTSLATADANDHLLVALLWFVPLTVVLLATVWVQRARGRENETR